MRSLVIVEEKRTSECQNTVRKNCYCFSEGGSQQTETEKSKWHSTGVLSGHEMLERAISLPGVLKKCTWNVKYAEKNNSQYLRAGCSVS